MLSRILHFHAVSMRIQSQATEIRRNVIVQKPNRSISGKTTQICVVSVRNGGKRLQLSPNSSETTNTRGSCDHGVKGAVVCFHNRSKHLSRPSPRCKRKPLSTRIVGLCLGADVSVQISLLRGPVLPFQYKIRWSSFQLALCLSAVSFGST